MNSRSKILFGAVCGAAGGALAGAMTELAWFGSIALGGLDAVFFDALFMVPGFIVGTATGAFLAALHANEPATRGQILRISAEAGAIVALFATVLITTGACLFQGNESCFDLGSSVQIAMRFSVLPGVGGGLIGGWLYSFREGIFTGAKSVTDLPVWPSDL